MNPYTVVLRRTYDGCVESVHANATDPNLAPGATGFDLETWEIIAVFPGHLFCLLCDV
jgi:hypothetical protein